ncbi:MAG: hypothetical protein KIT57_04445 [Blastocatellales bacterium]|nr:hypothetical protein [Blastocatellales bacterium]
MTMTINGSDEVFITRAPGRLDLMGGIADYSGSLVLQLPIAEAVYTALQRLRSDEIRIESYVEGSPLPPRRFSCSLRDFTDGNTPIDYHSAQKIFAENPEHHWAAYIAGAFVVLMRECRVRFSEGARIVVYSQVPEGKGVSSSAALEVASMQAICAAYGIDLAPVELAFMCQRVENLIAGAPCGVMDQMTSACGENNRLLALLCQPGEITGTIPLPEELAVWGIDSGIRHAVTGADYGTVRTAAFMGYSIIAHLARMPVRRSEAPGVIEVEDDRFHGYLANLSPEEFEAEFKARLPEQISGGEFIERYGGITDTVTRVEPEKTYPVLAAASHPIYEHARVNRFAEVLEHWDASRLTSNAEMLGRMMYESHASYSECGLGSSGTDQLVRLVSAAGPAAGLYGAKITGGGCGGTVAVLGLRGADTVVRDIANEYSQLAGYTARVLTGSSPGAAAFGYRRTTLKGRSEC